MAVRQRHEARRRAAVRKAAEAKVQALLVTCPADVGYLTGFSGQDSCLLLGRNWARLITDGRFAEQARRQCRDIDLHVRTGAMPEAVSISLRGRRVRSVGCQKEHLTLSEHEKLAKALGGRRIKGVAGLLSRLREVKDEQEIRAIRRAVRVAERGLRDVLGRGRRALVGRTERDVAAELDYRMSLAGADGPAFETIVAAGRNSSLPHHRPGRARIRAGQAVLIDWGAKVAEYCSDLTRVVFTGTIPPDIARVYDLVRRAQSAAIRMLRAGMSAKSPDRAARTLIAGAGYGERFVHGVGHGLGRAVHESPVLGRLSGSRLRAGMVVTVEPGIYLPGVGGVRIEDDVLVTPAGGRRLSSLPRSPAAMVLR